MTIRQDDRLVDGAPMTPVQCRRCAGDVLVRKSSWEQTSIQWTGAAMAACPSLADDRHATCPALLASIQEAVRGGEIKVVDG